MSESNYERIYKGVVRDFFDGRTSYDNDSTVARAMPLLDMVTLRAGQRVLDVATGTGIVAIEAARRVEPTGNVIGTDFSSGMLRQAKEKSEARNLNNIEWVEADADYLDYEAESFDVIFCSSALVYFQDILRSLQNWHRWLKTNGTAVFSGWSEQSYPAPWIIEACALHGVELHNINAPTGTREKCVDIMQSAGFSEVVVKERQLGSYKPAEALSEWDGSWFHPHKNPLINASVEKLQLIVATYRERIALEATEEGVWCESLAYYVSGKKQD